MSIPGTPGGYASNLRSDSPFGHTLQTKAEYSTGSDDLVLNNGESVKVSGNSHGLKVGCVTITWAAWKTLVKRVGQIEGAL